MTFYRNFSRHSVPGHIRLRSNYSPPELHPICLLLGAARRQGVLNRSSSRQVHRAWELGPSDFYAHGVAKEDRRCHY